MLTQRRLLIGIAITAATGGLCFSGDPAKKAEIVKKPPAWDAEAAAAFAKAGIPIPRTVMTVETDAPLDLAWIREAFGYAIPLSAKERKAIEQLGRSVVEHESRRGGGGAAGGARPRPRRARRTAAAPGDDARPEPSPTAPAPPSADSAREPRAEGRSEAREDARGPAQAGRRGRQNRALEEESDSYGGEAPATKLEAKKAKGKAGKLPKPVLSDVKTAPRLAKLLFRNASGKFESLVPRGMRVVTFLEGARARTIVDLVFQNPHGRRLQGTFYYPLPDGASPAAFAMFPGTLKVEDEGVFKQGSVLPPMPASVTPHDLKTVAPQSHASSIVPDWKPMQTARVVEQKRAAQIYEEIVRRNIDPALLEWSGGNTFKARVFPIEAKSLKRVVLCFEQTLLLDQGVHRYLFPMPGEPKLGPIEAVTYLQRGTGTLLGERKNDESGIRAPSGPAQDAGSWLKYEFTVPAGYKGALDVALQPAGDGRAFSGKVPGLGGRAFYARLKPSIPNVTKSAKTGSALFLVDTSLSEEGVRRSLSGQLLLKILSSDTTIERFAVMLFDVRSRWVLQKGYLKNTPENRAAAAAELKKIYLEGATNFDAALGEVSRQSSWIDGQGTATRFLLSDGLITWGLDRTQALLDRHQPALKGPWFTYRFGDAATNRGLYAAISRATSGQTVSVLSASQLASAAEAHRKAPVRLKDVRVTGATVFDLVVAGAPRLLFPGQELEIAGRMTKAGAKPTLELVLEINGKPHTVPAPIDTARAAVLAPRAWAELWVRKLEALDDVRLDKMVVALSQAFGLANKAASLLILEGKADWVRYDVKKEQVDLTDLMKLRVVEEDKRRDKLMGIHLDDVPRSGQDLVRHLKAITAKPTQPALPLLDRPLAGGDKRIAGEQAYRAARKKNGLDVNAYDTVARVRAMSGDTMGAVRALSSLVEKRPKDPEANRLVGYACLALGQYAPAAELFERVRLNRPFEPQSYLEEALALEAIGDWAGAARNHEILQARGFPRHVNESRVVSRYHYARMLKGLLREAELTPPQKSAIESRLAALQKTIHRGTEKTALQVTIHWNTDATDIDLWVVEPEQQRCFYSNKVTKAGGKLFWDNTSGYGPEIYRRATRGAGGEFDVLINYYGKRSPRWSVPTAVLSVRDRDVFGAEDGYTRRFQMRILPKSKAVLRLGKETF